MKSVVLVFEDAAGLPQAELDGRTPLEIARCPAATRIVAEGWGGVLGKAPGRALPTAETRLATLCGLPPASAALAARGPLEAVALGADVSGYAYAFRGDLVTLDDGLLRDGQLARLTLQETEQLAREVQTLFDPARVRFIASAPGRTVVLVREGDEKARSAQAPWLLEGEDVSSLPSGHSWELFREVLEKSAQAFARQTINDVRVDLGENPASALWLWGGGSLARLHGDPSLRGLVLTQSAMAAGLGTALGFEVEPLLDPWAAQHPSEVIDDERLRRWFKEFDRIVVYVEAPPELRRGPARERVRLLERMDVLLTQPLLEAFKWTKDRRLALVSVESAVPEEGGRRAPQLVAVWGSHMDPDSVLHWDEPSCKAGRLAGVSADEVARLLIGE
ncbi:MAG: hypothetical protein H3C50_07965 [Kiritimatiellae bacterium]|nr:hypothetical protein [Kiritimatiellia bacterium]MCO5069211.1 hypothetical protein [Kiritimatiellia bacterium]